MKNIVLFITTLLTIHSYGQFYSPIVYNDSIYKIVPYIDIKNGEQLFIGCKFLNDTIIDFWNVEQNSNNDSLIIVSYQGNTLSVHNPFYKGLFYNAHLYSNSTKQYYMQFVYPVHIGDINELYNERNKLVALSKDFNKKKKRRKKRKTNTNK
ncbi:MAG: hypothetical protein HOB05_03610 [Bacteroidetes bacterium]|jgi:hypothetical protein|nr:hypothetical protein [Bacteroidota bacterium]MBT7141800.1 hypothetical protein [Bacteroidota bacterium]